MGLTKRTIDDINRIVYRHIHKGKRYPRWRGHTILKDPSDLILYQQVIFKHKPDYIIETGTKWGGSAVFLADICELCGNGHVISIDINPRFQPEHKRITYIRGNSIDKSVVEYVKSIIGYGKTMVILDSKHTDNHVRWELYRYSKLVTKGQYLVVEDCYNSDMTPSEVMKARDWFIKRTSKFRIVDLVNQFLIGLTRDGWMQRK